MNIYVISYDRPLGLLRGNEEFLNVIRSLGHRSIRPMERTWLVATTLSIEIMTQRLEPYLRGAADRLLIVQVSNYYGLLPEETWDWINRVSMEFPYLV